MKDKGVYQDRHSHTARLRTVLLVQFRRDSLNGDRVFLGNHLKMFRRLIDAHFKVRCRFLNECGRSRRGLHEQRQIVNATCQPAAFRVAVVFL